MKYRLLSLLAIAFSGCAASLPTTAKLPEAEDRNAIEAAVYAWRIAGLPWAPLCDEELGRVHVVVTEPEEFTRLCGRRPVHGGGNLYACNTQQDELGFPHNLVADRYVPLLVISKLQPEDHRRLLVVHETMHWLERCSGKGIDFDHADRRVWNGARLVAQRDVSRWLAARTVRRSAGRATATR